MASKHYPSGKRKDLSSMNQIERSLWKVERVYVTEDAGGGEVCVADLWCSDGLVFRVTFADRTATWNWLHRPALDEAMLIWREYKVTQVIDHKAVNNYPWKVS